MVALYTIEGVTVSLLSDEDRVSRPGLLAEVYPDDMEEYTVLVYATYIDLNGSAKLDVFTANRLLQALRVAILVLINPSYRMLFHD